MDPCLFFFTSKIAGDVLQKLKCISKVNLQISARTKEKEWYIYGN